MPSVIDSWLTDQSGQRADVFRLKHTYELQAEFLFDKFEPTRASHFDAAMPFIGRLDRWLENFDTDEDRWAAFRSLRYFLFVGPNEVEELYRCAVENVLYPWLADVNNLDIFLPLNDHTQQLREALKECWPCPVTDSLRINGLLHRTGLKGRDLRPDWHSLRKLASRESIDAYVQANEISTLALFEDFVGSGSQCAGAIEFALSVFSGLILFCPLVICYQGDEAMRRLQSKHASRLTYRPVVRITKDCLVGQLPSPNEPKTFAALRVAIENGYSKIGINIIGGAYGFKQIGCLYGSYSNCPNNAPPIYHATSSRWAHALFPRETRV